METVVTWASTDPEADVLARIAGAAADEEAKLERVAVKLGTSDAPGFWGVVSAASYNREVQVGLEIVAIEPILRSIELVASAGGAVSTSLGVGIWAELDVSHVTRLRCNAGSAGLWDKALLQRFAALRVLNLSHANLLVVPGAVGALPSLQELRLVGNQLKILPPEIGQLRNLRVLAADSNELAILPGELRRCAALEELTLEDNRLASVLFNFADMRCLRTLLLFGNPLEFLPEISPCQQLRSLSVANLRVRADPSFAEFQVELLPVAGPSTISMFDTKSTDKLRPIFSLMLRRSSGHHPLLAGALREFVL